MAADGLQNAPIGVFDSGLGGLSVVRELRAALPHERILYVADQAHVPYGGRELGQVCGFACGISAALIAAGCKAVVMACNISSATALPVVEADYPDVPVLGTIRPGASEAARLSYTRHVAVLATEGTVRSGAYTRALHALDPDLRVTEIACPAFVPLIEAEILDEPLADEAARLYLHDLKYSDADAVILGCTHYPFLLPILKLHTFHVHNPNRLFIDPARQTVRTLAERLGERGLLAPASSVADDAPDIVLTTTGDVAAFAAQVRRFLPDDAENAVVAAARWEAGRLRLPLR